MMCRSITHTSNAMLCLPARLVPELYWEHVSTCTLQASLSARHLTMQPALQSSDSWKQVQSARGT